jgi:hypothetical protein
VLVLVLVLWGMETVMMTVIEERTESKIDS